jgi:hypothetical protein
MNVARRHTLALALAASAAAPAAAQDAPPSSWLERVSVSAAFAELRPAGRSELFTLAERAFAPGLRTLRPRLAAGELHVRLGRRWGVLLGTEAGGRTVSSVNLYHPLPYLGESTVQTSLDLGAVHYVGVEWTAVRWRDASARRADRLRLVLGAGGGVASYRLRQWGEFVDVARRMAFVDDFRSAGRGAVGYAGAAVEVPVRPWIALRGDVRRQVGTASMSDDFATFDRLDLGGTRLSAGVRVHPAAVARKR